MVPGDLASHGRARRLSRLGIGCAEQRLVGGAEVGCGQATWVQLPDLFGYGDGDLDVLAAAGGVEVWASALSLGWACNGLSLTASKVAVGIR